VTGDLDRLYAVPTAVTARLVGGPYDGREQSFPGVLLQGVAPRLFFLAPEPEGLPLVGATAGPPPLIRQVVYEALRDGGGFYSRDDQGRVRFDFWGPW
jgi:hypothetical protein